MRYHISTAYMAKTESARAMDELQMRLQPGLKECGFRMRSRTFNRTTSDGLTHVINFQMGRFDPPGTSYIPWFRKNLYGKFTINIGVYAPEVAMAKYGNRPCSAVQEVECCVRMRLAHLSGELSDRWWDLPAGSKTEADLKRRFERDAFPFLARFDHRDSLLHELEHNQDIAASGGPPRITRAVILAARGQLEEARDLLRTQVRLAEDQGHSEYVQGLAERLGLRRIDV